MVFVSAGTGLAPMRAFLWERHALRGTGASLGEAALFNGIRAYAQDFIYRDELERFVVDGVLDHLHVATSRDPSAPRRYVQDLLREQGELVWRLVSEGGYVYVCGSEPMRSGVRAALTDVVADHGRMPREHAEAFVSELELTEGRYRPDLWG
jgi:sulfite reductase alpha subunit-like flavoprotein